MLDCIITNISQDLDLEQNVTTTFLLLRLPDGQTIRTAVDDAAAAIVVALSVSQRGEPQSSMQTQPIQQAAQQAPPPYRPSLPQELPDIPHTNGFVLPEESHPFEKEARIFGEQDGGDVPNNDYAEPPTPAPIPVPGSNVQRLRNGRIVVPQRTVPKSAYGYPMVANGGIDPDNLTTNVNVDDDGVGSV